MQKDEIVSDYDKLSAPAISSGPLPKPPSMYISYDIANDMSDKGTYKTKYSRPYENII